MIYVMLATGFEEIEAIAPVDILRRAGLAVQTVAVLLDAQKTVMGAHKLSIVCDLNIQEADRSYRRTGVVGFYLQIEVYQVGID